MNNFFKQLSKLYRNLRINLNSGRRKFAILEQIAEQASNWDDYVNRYKNSAKEIYLPSFAYVNWGEHLLNLGLDDLAKEKFLQSVDMAYNNPEPHINLGIMSSKEGKFEEAIEYFKKAIRLDGHNARAYSLLASAYVEINNPSYATRMFNKAILLDPRNPQIYTSYGISLAKMGKRTEALKNFEKANSLNPSNPQILYLWGILLTELLDFKGAIEKFNRLIRLEPFHADALKFLAVCYHNLGESKKAIGYGEKSLSILPENIDCYLIIAQNYTKEKDEANCMKTYEKAQKAGAASPQFYYSWGKSLQAFEEWEEAIEKFNEAIRVERLENPDIPKTESFLPYHGLSLSYLKLSQKEKAREALLKVIKFCPDNTNSLYNLGLLNFEEGNFDESIECYKKAIASGVDNQYMYFNLAQVFEAKNDYKNAIKFYEKTVEYDPKNNDAKINLANVYSLIGDNKIAVRKIRSAWVNDKENANLNFIYAVMLLKNKDVADALEKFENAYKIDNTMAIAVFGRAECLVKLNKPKEALAVLANYENTHAQDRNFLTIKLTCYLKMLEDEEKSGEEKSEYLVSLSKDICDKIISLYPNETWVAEEKEKLTTIETR